MRTAVFLVVLIASPAIADDPVPLRWSLKQGDTFYVTTRVTQDHAIKAAGGGVETTIDLRLVLRYRVAAVGATGAAVDVTYLQASVEADGVPGVDRIGKTVRGANVTLKLDEKHVVTKIDGHDAILAKFKGAPAVERDTAAALFGEAGIREFVGRPFDVLPRDGVPLGKSVTRADRGTVGGLTTAGKTVSTLEAMKDGLATVGIASELAISAAEGGLGVAGAKVELTADRASGRYTFDTKAGRLKEFAHETRLTGVITTPADDGDLEIRVAIRQKQTLSVSDKNPIRD